MKIVVTDETLITHQELHFRPEMDFPDYHVYPFTSAEQLLDRIGDADAIFINRIAISREVMKHCSHLKYIGLFSTGYNGVDIVAAKEYGITVCNVPQYSSYAVAQHTMALLLDITNRVSVLTPMIKSGGWNDENIISVPSMELCGKTLGIIGYGDIGRTFAGMAQAMGMNILAYKRQYDASSETDSLHFTDLDTLYKNADIISIHCPLNEETRGMINQNALAQMKDSTILLNTARGGILNEIDVAKALTSGKLYMVGIDVLSEEPPRKDNPLFSHPKCIVTPHVAWAAKETRMRLMEIAADNFYAYLEGHPQNIVHL